MQIDGDVAYDDEPLVYDAAGVSGGPEQIFFGGLTAGDITLGDLLVYDAELSATDLKNVNSYLENPYGL